MQILSIDTSTLNGSVSISDGSRAITEIILSSKVVLSEKLLFIIDSLLKSCGIGIDDLGLIAVSVGPGSFTGLRVGISTAKGLAYPLNIPVAGYSSLDALAYNLKRSNLLVVPMLDARKGEVYAASYRFKDYLPVSVAEKTAASPVDFVKSINEKAVFIGEGAMAYRTVIENSLGENALFGTNDENYPKSSNGAFIALNKFQSSGADDLSRLEPCYLRRSEAEVKFNKIKESNIDNLKQMFYKF